MWSVHRTGVTLIIRGPVSSRRSGLHHEKYAYLGYITVVLD